MPVFDTLVAELKCPETDRTVENMVQIFFRAVPCLNTYHVGDKLDDVRPEYADAWVRTDYICESCSPKTRGKRGDFVKVNDQRRHDCYIHMEDSVILEVITEEEFNQRGIENYVEDL